MTLSFVRSFVHRVAVSCRDAVRRIGPEARRALRSAAAVTARTSVRLAVAFGLAAGRTTAKAAVLTARSARRLAATVRGTVSGLPAPLARRTTVAAACALAVLAVPPLLDALTSRRVHVVTMPPAAPHARALACSVLASTSIAAVAWMSRLVAGAEHPWLRRAVAVETLLLGALGAVLAAVTTALLPDFTVAADRSGPPPGATRTTGGLLAAALGVDRQADWAHTAVVALAAPVVAVCVAVAAAGPLPRVFSGRRLRERPPEPPRARTLTAPRFTTPRFTAPGLAALALMACGLVAALYPTPVAPPAAWWGDTAGRIDARGALGFGAVVLGALILLPSVLHLVAGQGARHTHRVDMLLGARRIQDASRALAFAAAPLALLAGVVTTGRVVAASLPDGRTEGWAVVRAVPVPLVTVAAGCAGLTALTGLLVTTARWLRRTDLAAAGLRALGTRPGTLLRTAVLQACAPTVLATAAGGVAGLAASLPYVFDLHTAQGADAAGPTLARLRVLAEVGLGTAASCVLVAVVAALAVAPLALVARGNATPARLRTG